jgi:hypothetical protein
VAHGLTISTTSGGAFNGLFDLTNNDLDVQLAGSAGLSNLTAAVSQGFNPGGIAWQGSGGITSSSAAGDTTHLTAVGVILNSTTGMVGGPALYGAGASLGTFDGISPSATDLLLKFTYFGDANLDGKVDGSDYSRIDSSSQIAATGWYNGNFDFSGSIDGSDYTLLDNAFNTQGASESAAVAIVKQSVPNLQEPDPRKRKAGWFSSGPALVLSLLE